MLIRFICENFLSFDKEMEFLNTASSKSENLKEHVYRKEPKHIPILKGAAIYGANASGKSNFLKAINFSKNIITSPKKNISDHKISTRQNKFNGGKETKFEYEFKIEDEIFNYGFVTNWDKVLEEWLYVRSINTTAKEISIFVRKNNELIEEQKIKKIVTEDKKDKNFFEYCKKSLGEGQLFLHKLKEDNVKFADKILDWFERIEFIRPDTKATPFWYFSSEEYREFAQSVISRLDSNISKICYNDFLIKESTDIKDVPSQIAEDMFDNLTKKENAVIVFKGWVLVKEKGQIKQKEIQIERNGKRFALTEESRGINRLFDLIPFLFNIKTKNKIFLIDEIETSLHPHIARTLIEMFFEFSKDNESQLIFATHDCNLMDLDLMRKDEIWFIQRDKEMDTKITSLAEYKIRDDLVIEKGYLQGRFGAIPFIGDWKKIGLKNAKKKTK